MLKYLSLHPEKSSDSIQDTLLDHILYSMEQLKHECGVAMIRLLKPLEYYEQKYGTWMYGLNKLYLLMEKQHNRGPWVREPSLRYLTPCTPISVT